LEVLKIKMQSGQLAQNPSEQVNKRLQSEVLFTMTPQQVLGVYRQLDASLVTKVLGAMRDDFISFEYQDKRQYIPFIKASPGQQAAALLELLLNQEAGTLLIDQPEDDLDNKVIMKIVHELQKAKRKRQLVFATHNANFVVNGDADKVVALAPVVPSQTRTLTSARVEIEVDGAIETERVRLAITETVEGGQEAFELRSRKYNFREGTRAAAATTA
jgi:ABC-type cobalamin/Fe3+-siderophores transport system ATPase subunit